MRAAAHGKRVRQRCGHEAERVRREGVTGRACGTGGSDEVGAGVWREWRGAGMGGHGARQLGSGHVDASSGCGQRGWWGMGSGVKREEGAAAAWRRDRTRAQRRGTGGGRRGDKTGRARGVKAAARRDGTDVVARTQAGAQGRAMRTQLFWRERRGRERRGRAAERASPRRRWWA
jgi:hypothetical protein